MFIIRKKQITVLLSVIMVLGMVAMSLTFTGMAAENKIRNPFFNRWVEVEGDRKPKYWKGKHSFSVNWDRESGDVLIGDYSVRVDASTSSERNLYQYKASLNEDTTYHAELWVKGRGSSTVKLGIQYPSSSYVYYGDPVELTSGEWQKITLSRSPTETGDDGGIRIKTEEPDGAEVYLGAVWFSNEEPPDNWPHSIEPPSAKFNYTL